MVSFFEKLKKGIEIEEKPKEEIEKNKKIEEKKIEERKTGKAKEKLFEPEGQLAIDVFQTEDNLFIQSAIAGIKPEDLDISIENDVVKIKGGREKPEEPKEEEKRNYFYQECYWGQFSREIILPVEVDPSRIEASFKEGILTIKIPKIEKEKKRRIIIKE